MATALVLTLAFVVIEALAGWRAHSLALVSDAGHNFADAAALGLSWYAMAIARRRATTTMTFGYHRVGVLAALVNAASLVFIALIIFWEAFVRFGHPEAVDPTLMIAVAAVAVVLNTAISMSLRKGRDDLNVRSAYLHMLGDAVSAGGVVVAGIVVRVSGAHQADPIVSVLIGVLILWSSWGILRECLTVLLEGAPGEVNVDAIESALRSIPNVGDVHHVHAWTISSGFLACSCHLVPLVAGVDEQQQILEQAQRMLEARFDFHHTTIQIESARCVDADRACGPAESASSGPGRGSAAEVTPSDRT